VTTGRVPKNPGAVNTRPPPGFYPSRDGAAALPHPGGRGPKDFAAFSSSPVPTGMHRGAFGGAAPAHSVMQRRRTRGRCHGHGRAIAPNVERIPWQATAAVEAAKRPRL